MGDTVRLNAFGPLEAVVDGTAVPLGTRKQRALLAILMCRPAGEVPTGEIIEALWDGRPPTSAANNLRSYVHGLRRALGDSAVGGSGRPGYRLRPDRVDTDLAAFDQLCAAGEAARDRDDLPAARSALAAAAALRRDRAFAGLDDVPPVSAEADRLEERWLRAVEGRIEADLELGRAAELVAELDGLARRHPFRERLAALLMLALYRSGRQAEALAVFARTAAELRAELGVEPGAELAGLHTAVLRQDSRLDRAAAAAPRTRVPAELPPVPAMFVGREDEAARLSALARECRDRGTLPVLGIVGLAGTGKTALAAYWGHRAAGDYPDGQLFVDLRGFSAEPPMRPADALARLLRSLGVENSRIPDEPEERAALYRSLLAGTRTLVVLDNAASAGQVEPLLPGGRHNAVVVTSRNRLPSLTAGWGLRQAELRPLDADGAGQLLRRILGPDRVEAEAAAAAELAERCGRLPLALCIAAADLAEDPHRTIAGHLDRHRCADWLDTLAVADDPGRTVRAAFDLSYRALTARQRRLLGLLGLVPGPDFPVPAAVALSGSAAAVVRADLDRLAGAHLLQRLPGERFAFHDLIREYARRRAGAGAGEALDRLHRFYLDHTVAADRVLFPGSHRVTGEPTVVLTEQAARAWFERETPGVVAACRQGPRATTTRLADALSGHLWARRELRTWASVVAAGTAAARDDHEHAAMAIARATIANCRRDFAEAAELYEAGVVLTQRAGWRRGEVAALGGWAATLSELGVDTEMSRLTSLVALAVRHGWHLEAAKALMHLGIRHTEQGRLTEALPAFDRALEQADRVGSLIGRAKILNNAADVHVLRRDFEAAAECAGTALRIAREAGYGSCENSAAQILASVSRGRQDVDGALAWASRCLAGARRAGDRRSIGVAQYEVALAHDAAGSRDRAIEYHRAAYRLEAEIHSAYLDIEYAVALGLAEHRLGRDGPDLEEQLARARRRGFRGLEGAALAALAEQRADPALARHALAVQAGAGWWTEPGPLRRLAGDIR